MSKYTHSSTQDHTTKFMNLVMILREECVYLLSMHQLFILGGMILREECVYLLMHQLFILRIMVEQL